MNVTAARAVFEAEADELLVETMGKLVADGNAVWIADPYVPGVVGLVKVVDGVVTNSAYIVVYADGDWATSDEFEFEVDHL